MGSEEEDDGNTMVGGKEWVLPRVAARIQSAQVNYKVTALGSI